MKMYQMKPGKSPVKHPGPQPLITEEKYKSLPDEVKKNFVQAGNQNQEASAPEKDK